MYYCPVIKIILVYIICLKGTCDHPTPKTPAFLIANPNIYTHGYRIGPQRIGQSTYTLPTRSALTSAHALSHRGGSSTKRTCRSPKRGPGTWKAHLDESHRLQDSIHREHSKQRKPWMQHKPQNRTIRRRTRLAPRDIAFQDFWIHSQHRCFSGKPSDISMMCCRITEMQSIPRYRNYEPLDLRPARCHQSQRRGC